MIAFIDDHREAHGVEPIWLLVGLAGFIYPIIYSVGDDNLLRWGILLWYTTLGAIIGVIGGYTRPPMLKVPMPW